MHFLLHPFGVTYLGNDFHILSVYIKMLEDIDKISIYHTVYKIVIMFTTLSISMSTVRLWITERKEIVCNLTPLVKQMLPRPAIQIWNTGGYFISCITCVASGASHNGLTTSGKGASSEGMGGANRIGGMFSHNVLLFAIMHCYIINFLLLTSLE